MRKIILHTPHPDKTGRYRDAGSELVIGQDIDATRAHALIDARSAAAVTDRPTVKAADDAAI